MYNLLGNLSLSKIIGGGGGAPRIAASFYSAKLCILIFLRPAIEIKTELDAPTLKRSCLDTNYSKCIICQEENNHDLVVSPTNYQKVLDSQKERALYGDSYFLEVNRRLQIVTEQELVAS